MAQGYETQSYEVIKTVGEAELRFYPSVMMAKTSVNSGFSSLFRYISGNNTSQQKISMTTPVHMDRNSKEGSMEFVLPKKFSKENTPKPLAGNVKVYESEAKYYAAFSFGGYTNSRKEQSIIEKGKLILKEYDISFSDAPIVLVYNSPYTFFNRKNEVLFPIEIPK